MLRVLSFVCLAGCALCIAFSPALCEAAGVTSGKAWPSPSQHAPAGAWTPSPNTGVAVLTSGTAVGHGRLVSPQVWERYGRRPVLRQRGSAVTPPVMMQQEPAPAKPVKKIRKPTRTVTPQTAPKKAAVSTTPTVPKTVAPAPQPRPAETVSPAPAPTAPDPVIVNKDVSQPKAATPPAVSEPDNVSASWIIRRDPASAQGQQVRQDQQTPAAPSPAPAPQTPSPAPAGENAANTGATISAPWIMPAPAGGAAGAASEVTPAPAPVSLETTPAAPGA